MVFKGLLREVEEKIGLPKVEDVAQVLKNLPDEKTLKLVKGIISDIGKVKGSTEELVLAVAMVKFIAEADMQHLSAVKEITDNLVKLIRLFPKDILTQLPVSEIVEEIKKKMMEE